VCAVVLALMCANLLSVVARKSITADEVVLIPAGYQHLSARDFQPINEHPPLAKLLAALPLLCITPDAAQPEEATDASPLWGFWETRRGVFGRVSFWARAPAVLLTVALGGLIFVFARELFGARAAVLAVALYSLEPTVLAHGRVAQTDVPAAFGYLLVCYALYRYVPAPSWRRAAFLGLACGLALLAKFSMVLAVPVVGVTFAALLWRARAGARATLAAHACVVALTALLLVHAGYFFQRRPLGASDAQWFAEAFPAHAGTMFALARALALVLPTEFVVGVFWQLQHNAAGHPASLLGMYGRTGWWYYFPVAFALKTTLPFLLLSLAALAWAGYELCVRRERRFAVPLGAFALYTAFLMLSRIDIGVRYYLPAYPFLFMLGGALLARLLDARRVRRAALAAVVALLVWTGAEAWRAYPDQMSYFNQLAARRPHWQYLSDSNVEWGDDARGLAEYLRARGETQVRAAALAAPYTLRYYGVEYVNLLPPDDAPLPETRYVAIGASYLNGSTVHEGRIRGRALTEAERVNYFDAYRQRTPEAVIGGSIYLFRERE
jgi:4-amino-4-deoxy-L-arabinose transferase-like glycosyltransferase